MEIDAIVADLDEHEAWVLRERWVDHRLRSKGLTCTRDWKPKKQKAAVRLRMKGVLEAPELDRSYVQPTKLGWKVINAVAELAKAQRAMQGRNDRQYMNAQIQGTFWSSRRSL